MNNTKDEIGKEYHRKATIEDRLKALEDHKDKQNDFERKNEKEHAEMREDFANKMLELERRLSEKIENAVKQILECRTHDH